MGFPTTARLLIHTQFWRGASTFTKAAEENNIENLLVIDVTVAKKYSDISHSFRWYGSLLVKRTFHLGPTTKKLALNVSMPTLKPWKKSRAFVCFQKAPLSRSCRWILRMAKDGPFGKLMTQKTERKGKRFQWRRALENKIRPHRDGYIYLWLFAFDRF